MTNKITVVREGLYLGMGERGFRYEIRFNGKTVCYSDCEPEYIDEINKLLEKTEVTE